MKKLVILGIVAFFALNSISKAQDSLIFKGQLSGWMHYNPENNLALWTGLRYIPQLNYAYLFKNKQQIDLEALANIFGSFGSNLSDSVSIDGKIKAYRIWMRYSGKQFELRAGLQKINFGSAMILRPLMWFDEMDPRDPLNLTDGVWGILGRYYFLNNANIWLWALYGNEEPRGWEIAKRNKKFPEYGGRIQFPLALSEIGLSFHHQNLDMSSFNGLIMPLENVIENKMGFDIKIDWHIGLWFEGVWSAKNADVSMFKNQEMMTFGMDYTFGVGNGLYLVMEHLTMANDERAFAFENTSNFTATSISYPVGIFDNLSAIFYYDWTNNSVYNFVNWQKQFTNFSFYLMGYWNPINSNLPTSGGATNLFGGKGIQIMLIFNH